MIADERSPIAFPLGELIVWEDYQVFDPYAAAEPAEFRPDRYDEAYFAGERDPLGLFEKGAAPGAGRYTCDRCSKSYRWKHHLVEHVRTFCWQKKAECCPYCHYRTNRKWNLKCHMKRIHAGV
ncbi:longitudinals lacking protein, isoforms F/I/K/T [Megalopta genalis]|uniref:longitudinals lacking protein, isoforms F/I/K/T n=1 Tax=Megalopta genalis TaxID=115081 RepID=UPI0014435B5B|nr:zinc finger protein 219-like isoform X2 [Megalopta genalis]